MGVVTAQSKLALACREIFSRPLPHDMEEEEEKGTEEGREEEERVGEGWGDKKEVGEEAEKEREGGGGEGKDVVSHNQQSFQLRQKQCRNQSSRLQHRSRGQSRRRGPEICAR